MNRPVLFPRQTPAPIVRLPVVPSPDVVSPRVTAAAEIQVKRFSGRRADDDRYTATLDVAAGSPAALLAALADAAAALPEFHNEPARDGHIVVQVTIRL